MLASPPLRTRVGFTQRSERAPRQGMAQGGTHANVQALHPKLRGSYIVDEYDVDLRKLLGIGPWQGETSPFAGVTAQKRCSQVLVKGAACGERLAAVADEMDAG